MTRCGRAGTGPRWTPTAPISRARAEAQLGYGLAGRHTAAVVWSGSGTASEQLEAAAEAVVRAGGAGHRAARRHHPADGGRLPPAAGGLTYVRELGGTSRPLAANVVSVAAALEVLRWRGAAS